MGLPEIMNKDSLPRFKMRGQFKTKSNRHRKKCRARRLLVLSDKKISYQTLFDFVGECVDKYFDGLDEVVRERKTPLIE